MRKYAKKYNAFIDLFFEIWDNNISINIKRREKYEKDIYFNN